MNDALGQLLPIAVAAAVSSVPIMAMIVVLLSPQRNRAAIPYLLGWVIGALLVLGLTTVLANQLPIGHRPRQTQTSVGVFEILVGLALMVLGLAAMRRRPERTEGLPRWANELGSWGPLPAFWIGLGLNLRPKGFLLSAAASLVLRTANLGFDDTVVLIVIYTAMATSTITIPILLTLLFPRRMEPRLISARDWINANGPAVAGVIMLMIGAVILGAGITNL